MKTKRIKGHNSASARSQLPKCLTGIQGLDEITGGGLPRGRPTLICGGAGCGKTLFASEFLVRGAAQFGEPGVFMSFEETEGELKANVASLGFDLAALVLDTLEALFAGIPNEAILRAELRRLFRWLKDGGVTPVITAERGRDNDQLTLQSIGLRLEPMVRKGLLRFHPARPSLYGLQMHPATMLREIASFKPDVVIVDPITSLMDSGTDSETKGMIIRLIDFLKGGKVTSLFTSLTQGGHALPSNVKSAACGPITKPKPWSSAASPNRSAPRRVNCPLKGPSVCSSGWICAMPVNRTNTHENGKNRSRDPGF